MKTRATLRSILATLALVAAPSRVALAQETWTKVETKISTQVRLNAVTWAGSRFAAGGSQGVFAMSPDGLDWAVSTPTKSTRDTIMGICWTGTRIVFVINPDWGVRYESNQVFASPDGGTWSSSFIKSQAFKAVRWVGGRTVVLSEDLALGTAFSPDSVRSYYDWYYGTRMAMRAIAGSTSLRILVGDSGQVITSSNDSGWFIHDSYYSYWTTGSTGTTRNLLDIVHAGSRFVVVGEKGTILTTTDGISWTPQVSPTPQTLRSVAWTGSVLVAVGDGGTILTSPDGTSWTRRSSPTLANLRSVAWSGSRFIAVGDSGTILTSTSPGTSTGPRNAPATSDLVARSQSGRLSIDLPATFQGSPISIALRDLAGKTLWTTTTEGPHRLELAMPTLAAGLYRVVAEANGERRTAMVRWMP